MGEEISPASSRSSEDTTRRRLLTLMGAGGAAALATLVSSKEAQAGHDGTNVMHLGEKNFTPAGTGTEGATFITADARAFVIDVENIGVDEHSGGIQAFSQRAPGIQGNAIDPGLAGISGVSWASDDAEGFGKGSGNGVRGLSGSGPGVFGESESGAGVEGFSESGAGVAGSSDSGPGGFFSGVQNGVVGIATAADGDGVKGHADTGFGGVFSSCSGLALLVEGKLSFSTARSGVVPAGQDSVFVADADVTGESHISVTIVSHPGPRNVAWVERNPGTGFTLHMSSAPPRRRPQTSFTYLIVEPNAGLVGGCGS